MIDDVDRRISRNFLYERLGMFHVEIQCNMVSVCDQAAELFAVAALGEPIRTNERKNSLVGKQRERLFKKRNVDIASFGKGRKHGTILFLFRGGNIVKSNVGRVADDNVKSLLELLQKEVTTNQPPCKKRIGTGPCTTSRYEPLSDCSAQFLNVLR